jgi:2-keto-3-deoxy-L-rhamnonate aldolase RhmA
MRGMVSIRQRALNREVLSGTWLILGSSVSAEIAGQAGFDWVLLDQEHGMGGFDGLLHELQALKGTAAAPIVRVAWNEPPLVKRVLDLGAAGVMFPYVNTVEEATLAAKSMRYPPQGIRGLTPLSRPAAFGCDFADAFNRANKELITIIQIETEEAVKNAEAIANVEGVDVLFIGPMDLSLGMGIFQKFDHPRFRSALETVTKACRNAGKAAGILLLKPEQVAPTVADGFTFIALSSDGGELSTGMRRLAASFKGCSSKKTKE